MEEELQQVRKLWGGASQPSAVPSPGLSYPNVGRCLDRKKLGNSGWG